MSEIDNKKNKLAILEKEYTIARLEVKFMELDEEKVKVLEAIEKNKEELKKLRGG